MTHANAHTLSSLPDAARGTISAQQQALIVGVCGFLWSLVVAFSLMAASVGAIQAAGVLMGSAAIFALGHRAATSITFFSGMMLLHGFAGAVAYVCSDEPETAGLVRCAVLVVACQSVMTVVRLGPRTERAFRTGVTLAGVVFVIYHIPFLRRADLSNPAARLNVFSHVNHIGYIAAFTALSALSTAAERMASMPARIGWSACALASLAVLYATKSRTSAVAFLAGVAVLAAMTIARSKAAAGLALLGVIVAGLGATLLSQYAEALVYQYGIHDKYRDVSTVTGRTDIWRVALEMWSANPWLGVGPGSQYVYIARRGLVAHSAHNGILFNLCDVGLLGTLPLLAVLGMCVRNACVYWRSERLRFAIVVLAAAMAESLTEQFLFGMGTPAGVLSLLAYGTLCFEKPSPNDSSRGRGELDGGPPLCASE